MQPDEPDVHGLAPSRLAAPPENGKLTLVNVSMNFWSGSRTLGIDYAGMFAKADIVSTDVYPVELNCRQPWVTLETPYDVQLELSALGKPSGQWIEVNPVEGTCPDVLTPAMVEAEAWLAVEGGATWIGWFLPHNSGGGFFHSFSLAPGFADAVRSVGERMKALAPILLAPRLPIRTPWATATWPARTAIRSRAAPAPTAAGPTCSRRTRPARRSPGSGRYPGSPPARPSPSREAAAGSSPASR